MSEFEPKIAAFLCNWCSYAGADQAGNNRRPFQPNVRIIRVMCSGRVEPDFILKAFKEGADGVIVLGCHPGDCHYAEGNYKAKRRMALLSRMLGQFGIEPGRFRLDWVSAAEGEKFVAVTKEITDAVRLLGPLKINTGSVLSAAGKEGSV